MMMTRRDALRLSLAAAGAATFPTRSSAADTRALPALPAPTPAKLPRWRGFNLLNFFNTTRPRPFEERDFADIAELGFDFVRLPLDYRCWADADRIDVPREDVLKQIDRAVDLGLEHRIHVQISFHRAPGYTVARPAEAKSVWKDGSILETCAKHWEAFASRYQGRPNTELSFNPFNEPDDKVSATDHRRVLERVVGSIRQRDPGRLIICDGRNWANTPPTELLGLGVAASMHDYKPMPLTHYKARWANWDESWPEPVWPLTEASGKVFGRGTIAREVIAPWKELEARGMGVMVGEFGCHSEAPHRFVLSWLNDTLLEFKKAGLGWALWNFTGSFGVCDSGRYDVAYESWHGRKLDRGMLELLQRG